jgi:hypothetical protein
VPFDLASWDPFVDGGTASTTELVQSDPNDPTGAEASVVGRIESIAVSRAPEPAIGLLAAAALLALGAVRIRV